jgi:hypothetical protein
VRTRNNIQRPDGRPAQDRFYTVVVLPVRTIDDARHRKRLQGQDRRPGAALFSCVGTGADTSCVPEPSCSLIATDNGLPTPVTVIPDQVRAAVSRVGAIRSGYDSSEVKHDEQDRFYYSHEQELMGGLEI